MAVSLISFLIFGQIYSLVAEESNRDEISNHVDVLVENHKDVCLGCELAALRKIGDGPYIAVTSTRNRLAAHNKLSMEMMRIHRSQQNIVKNMRDLNDAIRRMNTNINRMRTLNRRF